MDDYEELMIKNATWAVKLHEVTGYGDDEHIHLIRELLVMVERYEEASD